MYSMYSKTITQRLAFTADGIVPNNVHTLSKISFLKFNWTFVIKARTEKYKIKQHIPEKSAILLNFGSTFLNNFLEVYACRL